MGLKARPVPGKTKSATLCEAFIEGAKASMSAAAWDKEEGNVFYGVKAGNSDAWQRALFRAEKFGVPFYTIDNSYFDPTRGTHFRVVRNGLQHTGFGETDGKRFAAIGLPLAPWRDWHVGGHVLVVEQSEDHMVRMVGEPRWLRTNVERFTANGLGPFKWRRWTADKPKAQATLADDLAGAQVVLTHTSAAAVMAVLAGVPACCSSKCAAFGMTHIADAARLNWAGVLADNQFTIDELKDGTAWRKLQT
jgi:hypothetical protein